METKQYKSVNYIGYFLLAAGVLLNPWVIDNLLIPNKPLLRHHKEYIIIFEILCISVGVILAFTPRINPGWLVSVFTIGLLFLFIEVALHLSPELFGVGFANQLLGKYHTDGDGIYYYDKDLELNFMKPHFEADMFFNGYRWKHKTDKKGFRNPKDRDKAKVAVIGDSFIYGHGVEQEEALAYKLEEKSTLPVFNLARQGDYAYPQMYLLEQVGLSLEPQYVFHFFFHNDVSNVMVFSREEVKEFLEKPLEAITFPPMPPFSKYEKLPAPKNIARRGLYLMRYINYIIKRGDNNQKGKKFEDVATFSKGFFGGKALERKLYYFNYCMKSLKWMDNLCANNNIKFVEVPVIHDHYRDMRDSVYQYCESNDITYVDVTDFMTKEENFLPRDFHFSVAGNNELADILANWIDEYEAMPPPEEIPDSTSAVQP